MKNIRHLLSTVLLLTLPLLSFGQQKVEEVKKEFFTKQLNLSAAEAEKFWPLYNEMEKKTKALRKEKHQLTKEIKNGGDTLSVDVLKTKVNAIFDNESAEIKLRKEYFPKFGDAIGYAKAAKLPMVEREFKRQLLQKLKADHGNDKRPPRPNRP